LLVAERPAMELRELKLDTERGPAVILGSQLRTRSVRVRPLCTHATVRTAPRSRRPRRMRRQRSTRGASRDGPDEPEPPLALASAPSHRADIYSSRAGLL
jgi:hypothetical protein